MKQQYFIPPPCADIDGYEYHKESSYSAYNYLKPGIVSYVKRRHFQIALDLTSKYFHKVNVIDFGGADGILLPSLANYFNYVVGIDHNTTFLKIANQVINKSNLNNVEIINNNGLKINELKTLLADKKYYILFLLEILEHIGEKPTTMYQDKIHFLKEVSNLIENSGIMVISVPKMVGISFLIQYIGLAIFKMNRSPMAVKDLINSSILYDTSHLEKYWVPEYTHIGFNHLKLEKNMENEFNIIEKRNDLFQVVYVITKRN